jgi:hypothetical protein
MAAELPFYIDDSAAVAQAVATVRGVLQLDRAFPILSKPGLGNHHVNMVPGQSLVQIPLPKRIRDIKASLLNGAFPGWDIQVFSPGVQARSL